MKRKQFFVPAAVILVAAVAFCAIAISRPVPDPMKAKFDRVQIGMAVPEVEDVLGGKGDSVEGGGEANPVEKDSPRREVMFWIADDNSWAIVEFADGRVSDKHWRPYRETALAKVWRWLHL